MISSETQERLQVIQKRIRYLENEISELSYHLPDTYQYLVSELDKQKCELAKIELKIYYEGSDDEEDL